MRTHLRVLLPLLAVILFAAAASAGVRNSCDDMCAIPNSCLDVVCDGEPVKGGDPGCNYTPSAQGTACDDMDDTTRNDECDGAGSCAGTPKCQGVMCMDVDACNVGYCVPETGTCSSQPGNPGASCGDPSQPDCDLSECDESGNCVADFAPMTTECGDALSNQCTLADSCDGGGTCSANWAPQANKTNQLVFELCPSSVSISQSPLCNSGRLTIDACFYVSPMSPEAPVVISADVVPLPMNVSVVSITPADALLDLGEEQCFEIVLQGEPGFDGAMTGIEFTSDTITKGGNAPEKAVVVGTIPAMFTCTPLAVELESFTAEQERRGIALRWETAAEMDTVGFRILRSEDGGESYQTVTPSVIRAQGTPQSGASYEYIDWPRGRRDNLRYYLEDIDIFGVVTRHGPIGLETRGRKPGR